ncbi:RE1-silencing transcription factor-like [Helicoverpa zea]|uniref:RE1-silencing transcription factor-like n=1 Tax=Helicoverpa zea TaxID=7113 RepID=UPI001F578CFC|nr:RE1-silencing transcription factor-like [Helicoverpa zea]
MSSQCYLLNVNNMASQRLNEIKPTPKEKVMSYEEKSVGSTPFFQCEACPYMAMAEDDIKFHLFTVHPDLAKKNGLADNIQISCPGCASAFDAEETLRNHLRNHHKMGIKDVKKMIKSLVQIALKNAKLKKESPSIDPPHASQIGAIAQNIADIKIPQVIEIVPDAVNINNDLPKGVAFISVDELNKMSTPNFEKVDPKEIIQEASINIVYTNDISTQFVRVSDAGTINPSCNMIQVSSVPPDLISSIEPCLTTVEGTLSPAQTKDLTHIPLLLKSDQMKPEEVKPSNKEADEKVGTMCLINGCRMRLKEDQTLAYHRQCHQNGKLVCPECSQVCAAVDALHTHLWKVHEVDMELPTCDVCGFKTYNRYRLHNVHMKCHKKLKLFICSICSKGFKNSNQLSKHKLIHKESATPACCTICQREFASERRLRVHVAEVHSKVKPFSCSHCDYSTARKEQLKLHIRSHTGDRPYECNQCSYRTGDHNALRRHKKQHSKENVYKCKHCAYTTIQSTVFTTHMISKHPNITDSDVHRCPYCPFKCISKDKYVQHLTTHSDKEGVQVFIEMNKSKANKPAWTIPSETEKTNEKSNINSEANTESAPKTVNEIPIEVYDCDSYNENLPQNFVKNYCSTPNSSGQETIFNNQIMATDLSKEDNNSDCVISESSNDTMMERHQFQAQHPLLSYDGTPSNLHGFLNPSVSMEQSLLQNNNVNSLTSNHCSIPNSINNNIMANFPIRLPPAPQISLRNNITLKPVDKISLPSSKVTGPIIKPTQILPVPSSSNSPVNISMEPEGIPRKKPKISVKSNLILKGPDQENMFHSQQKMAFRRLEDNERFGLGGPVTFNNLITTQFMQLQPEPSLSQSPSNIMVYPQEPMLADAATTPVDNEMNNNPQIFSFNQQINVNAMTTLPPPQKIQNNDPSYIKLESTIKQNTQSPSLERMCNANLLNNPAIALEYKASPPLEDIHKNMSEIKNEVKSDSFYNIPINNEAPNPTPMDNFFGDGLMGEKYSSVLMDLSGVTLQEIAEANNDVIEIDDNSDDNKLLPRLDMYYSLEGLYPHNDFHFLDADTGFQQDDINRIFSEVPIINQKDLLESAGENSGNERADYMQIITQSVMDPMMNTTVRPSTNKINVKNIELMKN